MDSKAGKNASSLAQLIAELLAPSVLAMGYDMIDLEFQNKSPQGGAVVRLFIDHLEPADERRIGIEDCLAVDRGVTDLLEGEAFADLLPDGIILEVSSPGIDRPLTRPEHFSRYVGRKARVKTFRPLTKDEVANDVYFAHHEKQKNFGGTLLGLEHGQIFMEVDGQKVRIPYAQVAKANLDIADDLLASPGFSDSKKDKQKRNEKR